MFDEKNPNFKNLLLQSLLMVSKQLCSSVYVFFCKKKLGLIFALFSCSLIFDESKNFFLYATYSQQKNVTEWHKPYIVKVPNKKNFEAIQNAYYKKSMFELTNICWKHTCFLTGGPVITFKGCVHFAGEICIHSLFHSFAKLLFKVLTR